MSNIDTTTIERFLLNVKRAAQARAKEMRLDLPDAVTLSSEISMVMARLLKAELPSGSSDRLTVAADGGAFQK